MTEEPLFVQQRGVVAEAVARWAADASPSPFNPRHGEFLEFIDLIFAVETEAETWVNAAPPEYLDAAISLVSEPPAANWSGWGAFTGSQDWDYYLEAFLGLWAHRFPAQFGEKAVILIENPASRAPILSAMADASSYRNFDSTPFVAALRAVVEDPSHLSASELSYLSDIVS